MTVDRIMQSLAHMTDADVRQVLAGCQTQIANRTPQTAPERQFRKMLGEIHAIERIASLRHRPGQDMGAALNLVTAHAADALAVAWILFQELTPPRSV